MSDHFRSWKPAFCLLLLLVVSGCGTKPTSTDTANAPGEGGTETGATEAGGKKKIIPVRRDVKELDGNWVMVVTNQRRDSYTWLVKLAKGADGKIQAEIIDSSNDKFDPKIESTEINGNSVKLKLKNNGGQFDFEGEFDGIAIRGTLAGGTQEIYLARLLPTSGTKLSDYVESALPPATDVFDKAFKAMQNQPQPKVLLQLTREHRTSPISLEAAGGLVAMHARFGFDDETLLAIVDQYLELSKIWGPRMHSNAEWSIVQQLVTSGRLPEEALKHLDITEKLMGENGAALKPRFQAMREQAGITIAMTRIHSKADGDRAAAYVELQAALKKQPYNWDILASVAEYAAANKQTDEAIEHYSTIVALPMLEFLVLARKIGQPAGDPTPTEALTKLWTERHGNADGLSEHVTKLRDERLAALKTEIQQRLPAPPADVGNHLVLVECFTGGQSPHAVATEIALDALRATYPMSQLVTLRYHQHNPKPDGLVNQDSEDRFAYYEMADTPCVTVNGAMLDPKQAPYRGFLHASGTAYALFRSVADHRAKETTPIRIELSGKIENGELSVQATVTGATEEQLPALRLRLALAEETVQSASLIGLPSHAMVVREMPGGARGIAPKKGELKFSFSMPSSELQLHLDEYLKRYETGNKIEIPAGEKPAVSNPLYLIGWVQNDKADTEHPEVGRAILQTAIVPVTGSVPTVAQPAPPKSESAKADSDTPPAPALPE